MVLVLKNKSRQSQAFFQALVKKHGERIYNLALMKSGHVHLAEDICQETFIRIYKGLKHFRDDAQMGTWIYRITLNVCYSMLKKESRIWGKQSESGEHLVIADEESDVEDLFFRQSSAQHIHKAIASLPPKQSDAITLYYIKEFQYSEVAEIMDIPINTVKSHIRRAKENLRALIQESDL